MGESTDLLLLHGRLTDGVVRLEVRLHANRTRIDLLAVDDDVDVRHHRLAEEVHVRRQAAAYRRGLAAVRAAASSSLPPHPASASAATRPTKTRLTLSPA